MNIIIKQKNLLEKLNYVIRGIDSRNTLPILNCIKLDLTNEGLVLFATDNDKAIKTFISNENIENINETGIAVIEGRLFYEYIKKMNPQDNITLETVENFLEISNNKGIETRIILRDTNEYPEILIDEVNNPITLSKKTFKTLLNQTLFAASTQESRPVLTGLNITVNENILSATATDAYRLARKEITLNKSYSDKFNIVIPTRNLNELTKMLDDKENDIELQIFDNKILFKFDDILMLSNLINDTYPDISNIIPKEFSTTLYLNSQEFAETLDRLSIISSEEDKNAVIMESENNDSIIISSNNPEKAKSKEKIYAKENFEGNIRVAFSSKYMLDALRAINSFNIKFLYIDELKPIIIENSEDDKLIQLILPVRLYV